jgi:signal transduction histidine kinase
MNSFFEMTFNLLTTPPGNYLYYIILAIFTIAALQSVYLTRRAHLDEARVKVMIGLFIVLLIQILSLSSSFLGWAGVGDPRQFLPPIDRAAILLMITVIFWVWAYPDHARLVDVVFIVVGAVILFLLAGNLFNQSAVPPEMPYNASLWDWVWQVLTLVTALVALIVLVNRRPVNWQAGAAFFAIILFGYILNLALAANAGYFSGVTRLAHLIAFLLLPTLAQRFHPAHAEETPPAQPVPDQTPGKRDFKELEAWLALNDRQDIDSFFSALTRLVCQTMRADRAFVVAPSDTRGQISFQAGYHAETGEYFPLTTASDAVLPAIARAAFFGRAQRFDHKENREELNQMAVNAQIQAIGSALFTPFAPRQKKWGGVLAVKSATRKSWEPEDETRQAALVGAASLVLDKIAEINLHAQSLKNMALDLESARRENISLKDELKTISEKSGYERAEPELNALLAVQMESQDLITSLQRDNRQLTGDLEKLRAKVEGSEGTDLPAGAAVELATARERIRALEESTRGAEQLAAQTRLVEAVLHELREPAVELNRLAGALIPAAGLQAPELEEKLKSLQATLEKMRVQVADLDQMHALENGVSDLTARETDLAQIIDETLEATRARMGQKAINLRINLPDDLPVLFSFPGTLRQVLVHVVENAIESSAIGAEIDLKVSAFSEDDQNTPYLLFEVSDWGGGRDMDEIRQAFKRRDDPAAAVPAVGSGGLFTSNRLIEAHGGRMWLDRAEDGASVFSILLPLRPADLSAPEQR